ncbi:MAG: hypothetical protein GF317_09455 [Candidatus Lokiarchaeota archaeon]|nr:hypothetical protein [Candidatus Lokiarchaeota archaeon]
MGNKLETLPDSLVSLKRLEHINISNNSFIHFPNVIFHLPSLQYITLDREQNRIFKKEIRKLENNRVINHSAK